MIVKRGVFIDFEALPFGSGIGEWYRVSINPAWVASIVEINAETTRLTLSASDKNLTSILVKGDFETVCSALNEGARQTINIHMDATPRLDYMDHK